MAKKSEEELWEEYKRTSDPKIREVFVHQYAPLVKYVAGKVAMGMPQSIEFDDLVGYGVFGLLDAIEKFDPSLNIKFKTYAVTRIRGAIYDELRAIDWVPRSIRQKAKELENAIGKLENKLGRAAKDEEIAEQLGIPVEEFHQTLLKLSGTSLVSINDAWFTGDDNDKVSILETIESPMELNPDTMIEKEEVKKMIVYTIEELPEKEKKVLILYYYEDLTLKEIGEVLDVTESRVSQLHTKAIMRLRSKLNHIRASMFA
ncbi:MAG: RNA polymerase sigma factor WhiG [Spirochaetota bacterium]